jgi:hypothetical protein
MPFKTIYKKVLQIAVDSDPRDFLRYQSVSRSGLTAFANGDVSEPDYMFAVACDAILRYVAARKTGPKTTVDDGIPFGPGKPRGWVFVDEVQDVDFPQMNYMRALGLANHNVILIGDPRQTLYDFRNAVGQMPFDREFMNAFLLGNDLTYRMASRKLLTNYRSRAEIVDLSEDISSALIMESRRRDDAENLGDPIDCTALRSVAYEDDDNAADKKAAAVVFFEGGHDKDAAEAEAQPKAYESPEVDVGKSLLGMLWEVNDVPLQSGRKTKTESSESKSRTGKKPSKRSYPAILGGPDRNLIRRHIVEMGERAMRGEDVAILGRYAPGARDVRYIQSILREAFGSRASDFSFEKLSKSKDAPLAPYPYLSESLQVEEATPPSSILLAGALFYIFSWSKEGSERRERESIAALNRMPFGRSEEEIRNQLHGELKKPERSIELELYPFIQGLHRHVADILPDAEPIPFEKFERLGSVIARFTLDVLVRYAVIVSRKSLSSGRQVPCRFMPMTSENDPVKQVRRVLNPSQSKIYFQAIWKALAETPLSQSTLDKNIFQSLGIEPEWMPEGGCLKNLMEKTTRWRLKMSWQFKKESISDDEMEDCIRSRATIQEQFARFHHRKTKAYTSAITKRIQSRIINGNEATIPNIMTQLMFDNSYKEARSEARLHSMMTKRGMEGFFKDLIKPEREASDKALRPAHTRKGGAVVITLATIHASKGLEWDHVLFLVPDPSTIDAKTSLRATRDLFYVAVTRARRTLGVVISRPADSKETSKDTSIKVAKKIIFGLARDKRLFRREIAWDSSASKSVQKDHGPIIHSETHHSELEMAQRCGIHHFIQECRDLPSMSPLPEPSYAFFFHAAMSSIAAAMAGTRVPLKNDVAPRLADIVKRGLDLKSRMCKGSMPLKEIEGHLGDSFINEGLAHTTRLMEGLVPAHFHIGGSRHSELLKYYGKAFLRQLAGVITASRLFEDVSEARQKGKHKILIESPLRGLAQVSGDDGAEWLPLVGVPDVRISGPAINRIYDYKTVTLLGNDADGADGNELHGDISQSTKTQMTLYQRLAMEEGHKEPPSAEVILVADLSVLSWDKVPQDPPVVPHLRGGFGVEVVTGLENAFVLRIPNLDRRLLEITLKDIRELRLKTASYASQTPVATFEPEPLIGEHQGTVQPSHCLGCESRWHCTREGNPADTPSQKKAPKELHIGTRKNIAEKGTTVLRKNRSSVPKSKPHSDGAHL